VQCRLKKTSPTAYCDCWEKCKCRSLIAGNQSARYDLLNRILTETDLVKLSNSRLDLVLIPLPVLQLLLFVLAMTVLFSGSLQSFFGYFCFSVDMVAWRSGNAFHSITKFLYAGPG